jgi:hypothetical protein
MFLMHKQNCPLGNAKIAGISLIRWPTLIINIGTDESYLHVGLEKDLGLKGFEYNIALTLFYIAVRTVSWG